MAKKKILSRTKESLRFTGIIALIAILMGAIASFFGIISFFLLPFSDQRKQEFVDKQGLSQFYHSYDE